MRVMSLIAALMKKDRNILLSALVDVIVTTYVFAKWKLLKLRKFTVNRHPSKKTCRKARKSTNLKWANRQPSNYSPNSAVFQRASSSAAAHHNAVTALPHSDQTAFSTSAFSSSSQAFRKEYLSIELLWIMIVTWCHQKLQSLSEKLSPEVTQTF